MMIIKQSKIGTAGGNSLRVGIPETIVDLLQLNRGDLVDWVAEVDSNGVTVTLKKTEE
ncbi:hypothetical protein [uncultured Methanobrevibacter sp.]|uniref:hypothetical protein n=1 Tax=uncultured Methanobrevibacter sp. TaxID=253161 RepID=UPI0025D88F7D|nr:hypothetical protein [uncultured Methanobrevibacter sp.]